MNKAKLFAIIPIFLGIIAAAFFIIKFVKTELVTLLKEYKS